MAARELSMVEKVVVAAFGLDMPEVPTDDERLETLVDQLRNVECYYGGELRDWMRDSVKRAADILSASQPREAAPSDTDGEALARHFHEVYERLAPKFNYSTRVASAVPWEDVPENNKRLMIAVAREILAARRPPVSGDNAEWRDSEFKKFMSRGLRSTNEGTVLWHRQREAFNAAWALASQPREAAPSDTDRALKAERLRQLAASYRMDLKSPSTAAMLDDAADTLSRTSQPVQVEAAPSDTDGVLAMLDDLNASGGIAYDDYSRLHDAVAMLGPAEPVQVEVTDDMVERAAEGIARERLGRHVESLDDYWDGRPDAKRLDIDACKPSARAALVAALGDGDHAE